RFFRPDPRVRQCRPGTRKPNGRGRWSRLSGRRVAGLTRRGCHRKMGCVYHNAAALKPGIAFPLTLEQCFRVAGSQGFRLSAFPAFAARLLTPRRLPSFKLWVEALGDFWTLREEN